MVPGRPDEVSPTGEPASGSALPARPATATKGGSRWIRLYPLLALAGALLLGALAMFLDSRRPPPVTSVAGVDVEVFVQPGCPHCEAARRWLGALRRERPQVVVVEHDVLHEPAALARLRDLATFAGAKAVATPALLVRGTLLIGWRDDATSGARVTALLASAPPATTAMTDEGQCPLDLEEEKAPEKAPCATDAPDPADEPVDVPLFGKVRAREVGLPLFTVVLGLVDGFNPCAMWVLLFLLSLLVNLKSRSKMLAIAGTFLVASGVCYFSFMVAWLTFFDMVGHARLVQVILGVMASFVAAIHVKDFFAFHEGLTLSIPESAKKGLYGRVTSVLRANRLASAMVGVVVLAFLVNTVELLCTAGLPALYTGVLSRYGMSRWQEYAYIALYQLFYMFDDAVMLTIAVITLSKRRLQEGGGRWLKLVSGVVVAALGLLLLFRPQWLNW